MSQQENKKTNIINAALASFSKNGYKKTSVNDIALLAGVSKSMIFHYFTNKRNLYFFLFEFLGKEIMNNVKDNGIKTKHDFFERVKFGTEIKMKILAKSPHALSYMKSFYFEKDTEVVEEIQQRLANGFAFSANFALEGISDEKFKPGVQAPLVMRFLHTYAEGFMSKIENQPDLNIEEATREFYQCLDMLKSNLYKEEYL